MRTPALGDGDLFHARILEYAGDRRGQLGEQRLGAVVPADEDFGGKPGRRLEAVLEARDERIELRPAVPDENRQTRQPRIAVEQRRRQPQLRQAAHGHGVEHQIDMDAAPVMRAGKLRKAVLAVRQHGAVERRRALIEQPAASGDRGAMIAHGDIGDGDGACGGNDECERHR
ncbi:MAG: hypothetical protein WDN31_07990 [Hyphomicrobium sp.]